MIAFVVIAVSDHFKLSIILSRNSELPILVDRLLV